MLQHEISNEELKALDKAWEVSEEDEELVSWSSDHMSQVLPVLARLISSSPLEDTRWQIYEALGTTSEGEPLLRQGLLDRDPYCRRRALLSLAKLAPADAHEIAARFFAESDPALRQAAIEMLMTSRHRDITRQLLQTLSHDADDRDMLRQLDRVGLSDTAANREYVAAFFASMLNDSTNITSTTGTRQTREGLLMGPRGALKVVAVWNGAKLITVKLLGG